MTSFKRTQRKYVRKTYRVRNWQEYETGLRARGSLTVWLGLTDGQLANWNSPRTIDGIRGVGGSRSRSSACVARPMTGSGGAVGAPGHSIGAGVTVVRERHPPSACGCNGS